MHKHQRNKLHALDSAQDQSAVEMFKVFDQSRDYDFNLPAETSMAENAILLEENPLQDSPYPQGFSPFELPSGVRVGTILHRYLEKTPLNRR